MEVVKKVILRFFLFKIEKKLTIVIIDYISLRLGGEKKRADEGVMIRHSKSM